MRRERAKELAEKIMSGSEPVDPSNGFKPFFCRGALTSSVARFFFILKTKTGENIPNCH
jgi:hypothetical protein